VIKGHRRCSAVVLPKRTPKESVDVLAPFIVELFNRSLSQGMMPAVFKEAFITSLLN
jgi:hypothetical protein